MDYKDMTLDQMIEQDKKSGRGRGGRGRGGRGRGGERPETVGRFRGRGSGIYKVREEIHGRGRAFRGRESGRPMVSYQA